MHGQVPGTGRIFSIPYNGGDNGGALGTSVQLDIVVPADNAGVIVLSRIASAPDLESEIVSPDTPGDDRRQEPDAYPWASVREFCIAGPGTCAIEVLAREAATYRSRGPFQGQAGPASRVLPELPARVE